ncbi:MAG: hypothetical protein ACRD2X_23985 [Vicinamibacteraceae bacterium]
MQTIFSASFLVAIMATLWPASLVARTLGASGVTPQQQQPATCIGIVVPAAEGIEGNASDVATAVRDLLTSYLSAPALQIVALEARLPSPAMEEARGADCGYVLTTTLRRKAGGSGAGVLGKMAEGAGNWAAWHVPGSGMAAAAAQGAAIAGAAAIGSLASGTKAKDEVRLEYQLVANTGASVAGPETERLKAQTNGEDLVTPLVHRVAERVHAAMAKK